MKRYEMLGVGKKLTIAKFRSSKGGFTILELLIATAVFGVIILLVTTGIIRIGNIYYKGITSSRAQNTIRDVVNELSTTVQFTRQSKTPDPTNPNKFCLGDIRYTAFPNIEYKKGLEYTAGLLAEQLSSGSDCLSTNIDCSGSTTTNCVQEKRQLLGNNMRILVLSVNQNPSSQELWDIKTKIAYGDDDLLSNFGNPSADLSTVTCNSGSGSSFCAVASLDTLVKKRLE